MKNRDIIDRAITVAEAAATEFGASVGYVTTDEEVDSLQAKEQEARTVADTLRGSNLLGLLEETFNHLAEDIRHGINPDECDELATRIDDALRRAGYFDAGEAE